MVLIFAVVILLISAAIAYPKITSIKKIIKEAIKENSSSETIQDKIQNELGNADLAELKKIKTFGSEVFIFLNYLSQAYLAIPFALRWSLILRYGVRIAWRMPFNVYELWDLCILSFSFWYLKNQSYIVGLVLAVLVGLSAVVRIFSSIWGDKITIFKQPIHKLNLIEEIKSALAIIVAYSAIYYGLSQMDSSMFNQPIEITESLFYSIQLFSFNTYSEIQAVSNTMRLITLSESILGFGFVAVFLATFLNQWALKKNES